MATAQPASEFVLDLAPGVREPIVFAEFGNELTPAQAEALAGASDDFIQRIEQAAASLPDEELAEVWNSEREQADSTYRNVFGEAAYHQMSMETALRALGLPSSASASTRESPSR